jgi:hypothetical protein
MKIKILIGSNYPDKDGKEIRCEAGKICDVPDKIAKSLIKNKAAVKFDSKMTKEEEE